MGEWHHFSDDQDDQGLRGRSAKKSNNCARENCLNHWDCKYLIDMDLLWNGSPRLDGILAGVVSLSGAYDRVRMVIDGNADFAPLAVMRAVG
jgi:hypothetical protein